MTSELRTTEYTSEFVSGGPKNYAYRVIDTGTGESTTLCKVRGIALNYSAKQLFNFNVIRDMIIGSGEPTVMVHTVRKIKRKRKGGELWPLSPNPRIRRTDSLSSNADVWPTIRRYPSGINRANVGHMSAFTAEPSMDDDLKFKHSFSCIVIGPSGSRKTKFVRRFLQNRRDHCREPIFAGGIVWCDGEKSAVPSDLPANYRIHEGVPEDLGSANGETSLVILDDLLTDVYSKQVCELFTRGSQHRNLSVILITQNLFHQGRFCRDISLNANYIVAFKNVKDKKQFMFLSIQVYPEDSVGLYNAYLDATKEAYGYLVLDLTKYERRSEISLTHIPGRRSSPRRLFVCRR